MPLTADEQYAANMATLSTQEAMLPLVAQMAAIPLTNIQLMPSGSGSGHVVGVAWDVATQAWIPLCDLQDPVGTAEQVVEHGNPAAGMPPLWSPQQTIYTVLGIGMGYAIAAIAKRLLPYQRLVVWDPEAVFFKAMLYALDIKELFSGRRVEIFVGSDVLGKIEPWYMGLEVYEKLHMAFPVSHAFTAQYRKADYQAVMDKCMDMLRFHMVGLATWRQFGQCIGDNDIANMPEYLTNPGFSALKGLWQDKPAVCVAAGPSLQRNLAQLLPAAIRRQIALLTVGTTYGLVQGMGLEPDLVTTIDFQKLNHTDQFLGIPLDPDCGLVYLHSTYPQTPRRWPGPCFVAENSSDTMGWLRQWVDEDKGSAGMVQTVAHLNVVVALTLGANPIILLGQDLSMPAEAHHAAGSRAQDLAPQDVPLEAFLDTPDMHGQPVKTRHSFQSMLLVFARLIAEHPQTTFINASEQGLHIPGALHMPLAEALTRLQPSPDVGLGERPVFQGETAPALAARQASSLRASLKQVYAAYQPQVKPTFAEGYATLCRQVEEIGQWAAETVALWRTIEGPWKEDGALGEVLPLAATSSRQAALSSDILSDADTAQWVNLPLYEQIAASESILQERPHATGMYVIRHFPFIELKGMIPPPAASMPEIWHQRRYAASRLVKAAEMFLQEWPTVRELLRRNTLRLQPATHPSSAMARQQYRLAGTLLHAIHDSFSLPQGWLRHLAQYLRHTQQYAAALVIMEQGHHFTTDTSQGTGQHAARIRRALARYHADVRQALPAYFQPVPVRPQLETRTWNVDAVSAGAFASLRVGAPSVGHLVSSPLTGPQVVHPISAVNGIPVYVNGQTPAPPVQAEAGPLPHGEEQIHASIQ